MANFQLDVHYLEGIKTKIKNQNDSSLKKELHQLHYADIAELIEELNLDDALYLIKLLDTEKTADALAEVDEDFREKILEQLSAKEIAVEVEELDTDDAADIIAELPQERQEKVLSQIENTGLLKDIRELLKYDENTAGSLMAKELVKVLKENLPPLYNVNLISYNETGEFKPSTKARIRKFRHILERQGIEVVERYRFGRDIKAACGQLAIMN